MRYRKFGSTDLELSETGFGAWAIGGPSMAGDIAIGWGKVDDKLSVKALKRSADQGINFFDTADFYGLGHSEELIGKVFGKSSDIIIATKVGHKLLNDKSIALDYSYDHIIKACEDSLRRLRREQIDYYQLHSARTTDLEQGDCIKAMEDLTRQGKIRYWGLSLNTFHPSPEAEYMIKNKLGYGFQLVFNIINRRALNIIRESAKAGYGIIARMPLQFGLLTGKFNRDTRFPKNDHRAFRLSGEMLEAAIPLLDRIWTYADKYDISKTSLAMSFIMSYDEISTVIPGIKNPEQARENARSVRLMTDKDREMFLKEYGDELDMLMDLIEKEETGK